MSEATEIIRAAIALEMLPPSTLEAVRNRTTGEPRQFKFDRYQISEIRQWLSDNPQIDEAVRAAHLALDEYYNGDCAFGEAWLLKAYEANQKEPKG